jgi:caffeic acid 3-O-methyltransferase
MHGTVQAKLMNDFFVGRSLVSFHLKDAVLEGGFTFEKAHGMSLYQYSSVKDPTFGEALVEAMAQHSTLITKQILKKYKGFEGLSSLVDVGGGIGTTLNLIISQYPSIKGINFDVSEVLRNAPSYNGACIYIYITLLN